MVCVYIFTLCIALYTSYQLEKKAMFCYSVSGVLFSNQLLDKIAFLFL